MAEPPPDPPLPSSLPGPLPGRGFVESAGIAAVMLYAWCLVFAFFYELNPALSAVFATLVALGLGLTALVLRFPRGGDLGLSPETREALGLEASARVADGRYWAHGSSEGRGFQLFSPGGGERNYVVRVPLASDVRFSLCAAGTLRVLGIREDLPQLGKTFNQRYRVDARDRERVAALLDHGDLALLLRRLFSVAKVQGVRAGGGWLDLYWNLGPTAWEENERKRASARLPGVIDGATRLASLLERRVIRVTGVERSLALSVDADGGSRTICPYCRDDLDPDSTALEVCPRCHTAHHADCYAEAGGCTIYACAPPREPERERA